MAHYYWNDLYMGWGWFLWFGIVLLMFSSMGNWGYTYQAHRKYAEGFPKKSVMDILNDRYARGEIAQEEYNRIKADVNREAAQFARRSA